MNSQNPFSSPISFVGLSERPDYGWIGTKLGFWFALPFSLLSIGAVISAAIQTSLQPLFAFVFTIPAIVMSTVFGWWWGEKGSQMRWMGFVFTGVVQGVGFLMVMLGILFSGIWVNANYKVPLTASDAVGLVYGLVVSTCITLIMGLLVRWRVRVLRGKA